jgi:uncharacterized SAM-binding protein YcdF (DUF218 family)
MSTSPQKKFRGLLERRERWGLSWRGWLALVSVVLLLGGLWVLNIHSFLAPTQRVDTKILVVEGWVHEYAIRAAVAEFQNGRYEKIYATGGPITGTDGATNDFNTAASVGAELLVKCGVPPQLVQMTPSHVASRDRTYSSALALRDWFREHQLAPGSINVLTEDAHARRTRLLFQEALGRKVSVGIIAVADPDYDARRWWRYSEGVREILGETIAFVYAKLFFSPPPAQSR